MLRMFINNEEVVSDKVLEIKKEMLSTSSTILNNCYPKSWEDDKNYNSRFYFPKDYSLCTIKEGEFENGVQQYITKKTSGINPTFETNLERPLESLTLYGKCEQKITTGKNLFKPIATQTKVGMSLTYNSDDGSYTLNGTATSNTSFYVTGLNYETGTYTLSLNNSLAISNSSFYVQMETSSGNVARAFNVINAIKTATTTAPITALSIVIPSGLTLNNFVFKPQLEIGSIATSFEQYGVSPSPDQPSEIEVVKANNLLPNNATSQTKNGVAFTVNDDKTILVNGTSTAVTDLYIVGSANEYVDLGLPTGNYILSGCPVGGSTTAYMLYAVQKRGDNLFYYQEMGNGLTINVEIGDTFRIFIRILSGKKVANALYKPMLSKNGGNYAPYGNIQIVEIGKNLFDGELELGTYLTTTGERYNTIDTYRNVNYISINPNTTYTFSIDGKSQKYVLYFYDKNKTFLNYNSSLSNGTFMTPDKAYYVNFRCFTVDFTSNYAELKVQLEKGPSATGYEPYTEEVENIDLKGNELCSLPNGTRDELVAKDGKIKINKKIGKIVLNGSENWQLSDYTNETNFSAYAPIVNYSNGLLISDLFIYQNNVNVGTTTEYIAKGGDAVIIGVFKSRLNASTINDFKSWLSTHNTTVYYELETPEEIDLQQTLSIKTHKGINQMFYFSLETEMDVWYLYKTYDLLFAGIVKNTGNISLNPRYPHYCSLQILGFETFLSEGENLDFVIANKTITEAINMIIEVIKPYGFELGTIDIFRAGDVIGAYSTLDKSPYDVFQYIADITGSRWRTRITDYNKIAIDFYDPTLMPRAKNIQYTPDFFVENNIEDISFNYNTGDYRNKQIILSNQVLADIEYETLLLADGYSKEFILEENLGKLIDIKVDGITKTFASDIDKKLGVTADFYYTVGKNNIESETVLPSNSNVYIKYVPIVKGRQIVYNNDEVNRISNQLEIKGIIARYENRNDSTSNAELNQIAQSYIKYKGNAEITLTLKTFNKDLFEIGEVTHFESPISDLEKDYMIKKKVIQLIPTANYVFYTYEMSNNFNSEKAINYFDNQRAKLSGNIAEGDYIERNIDFENTANIIFQKLTIEEITDTGSNTLDLILDGTL